MDSLFYFCLKTFLEKKYFGLNSKCSKLELGFYLRELFLFSLLLELSLNNHLVQQYFFSFLFDINSIIGSKGLVLAFIFT